MVPYRFRLSALPLSFPLGHYFPISPPTPPAAAFLRPLNRKRSSEDSLNTPATNRRTHHHRRYFRYPRFLARHREREYLPRERISHLFDKARRANRFPSSSSSCGSNFGASFGIFNNNQADFNCLISATAPWKRRLCPSSRRTKDWPPPSSPDYA